MLYIQKIQKLTIVDHDDVYHIKMQNTLRLEAVN